MACLFDVASVIEMHVHVVQIHISLFVDHWSSVVSTQGWHVCIRYVLVHFYTEIIIEWACVSFRLCRIGDERELQICIICRFGFLLLTWLGFCDAIPYNNCKEWYQYKVTQHRSEDYQMTCVAVLCNCFMSTRKKKLQKYDRNDLISNQNWYSITFVLIKLCLDICKRYLMIICNKRLIWGSIDIFSLKRSSF